MQEDGAIGVPILKILFNFDRTCNPIRNKTLIFSSNQLHARRRGGEGFNAPIITEYYFLLFFKYFYLISISNFIKWNFYCYAKF